MATSADRLARWNQVRQAPPPPPRTRQKRAATANKGGEADAVQVTADLTAAEAAAGERAAPGTEADTQVAQRFDQLQEDIAAALEKIAALEKDREKQQKERRGRQASAQPQQGTIAAETAADLQRQLDELRESQRQDREDFIEAQDGESRDRRAWDDRTLADRNKLARLTHANKPEEGAPRFLAEEFEFVEQCMFKTVGILSASGLSRGKNKVVQMGEEALQETREHMRDEACELLRMLYLRMQAIRVAHCDPNWADQQRAAVMRTYFKMAGAKLPDTTDEEKHFLDLPTDIDASTRKDAEKAAIAARGSGGNGAARGGGGQAGGNREGGGGNRFKCQRSGGGHGHGTYQPGGGAYQHGGGGGGAYPAQQTAGGSGAQSLGPMYRHKSA